MMFIIFVIVSLFSVVIEGDIFDDLAMKSAVANCPYLNNFGSFCPMVTNKLPPNNGGLLGRIGLGLKMVADGSMSVGLPVTKMTYAGINGGWNNFILPDNAVFNTFSNDHPTNSQTYTNLYTDIDMFISSYSETRDHWFGGSFTAVNDIASAYHKYFGSGITTSLAQEHRMVYYLSMPKSFLNNGTIQYKWEQDSIFAQFEQNLPSVYNQSSYMKLIDNYGTVVNIASVFGGIVDQFVIANLSDVRAMDPSVFEQNTWMELLVASQPSNPPDYQLTPSYLKIRTAFQLNMYGGDPKATTWEAKNSTLKNYPVLIQSTVLSLDNFIMDPIKKANVARAIKEYNSATSTNWNQQIQQAEQEKKSSIG